MRVSKSVGLTFLLAVLGVLVLLVLVADILLGPFAVAVLVLLLVSSLGVGLRRTRRRQARLAAGRTCTCCTGTVHDPVQVI